MSIRNATTLLGFALLVLPACGGGGGGYGDSIEPLNVHEKSLVGRYELSDFHLIELGEAPYTASQFDAYAGTLELRADRTGAVALELCESAGAPTFECAHGVVWDGDAGLVHLHCVDGTGETVTLHWELEGMGGLRTETLVPTNAPSCQFLLVTDGCEEIHWVRVQ